MEALSRSMGCSMESLSLSIWSRWLKSLLCCSGVAAAVVVSLLDELSTFFDNWGGMSLCAAGRDVNQFVPVVRCVG